MKVTMTVSGRVQGVGFRYMTKMVADQLGILGIVKNEANGDVYIEAMGSEVVVKQFIEEIKKSPAPFGHVDHLDLNETANFKDYHDFAVTY
ncbi:acylphosphatase [Vagococcus carniphilus]|uniref:acylphosphatase n=1 Tax=Vagococcus carniphilus TaxID=218144 RepID=A0AAW8TZE8_9ENTE|nr:acylphosphatase [Vagococcus carniphilus]MDT2814805.1 acylphosphatase [Vagococcus carniphilus]MDT2831461.1 acylphosphatase [Vagococcus carniphilus]MDT2832683.1 acylphosphatase [Vagococcus carniphilus]MDT2840183.1 acylphosphatase [Vagococcus carniphilus]MDT2849870.1 acylphosphatase [Vagococcus carniphilus]